MPIGAGVAVTLKRYECAVHGFFQVAGIFSLGRIAIRDVADCIRGQLAVTL
jgi:acetyl esterase/lipase